MKSVSDPIRAFFTRHLFARYVCIGLLNTAVGYLLYAFFLFVGFEYKLANLFALLIGVAFSFKTQGTFVFKNPDNSLIFRYIACWTFIYFCNTYVIGRLVDHGFSQYAAGAIAIPVNVLLSYFIQKHLIFRKPPEEKSHVDRP